MNFKEVCSLISFVLGHFLQHFAFSLNLQPEVFLSINQLNCKKNFFTNLFIIFIHHPSIHAFIHPSIHSCIHSSIHPFMHSFIHPSIHAFIHPSIHSRSILSFSFFLIFCFFRYYLILSFFHLFNHLFIFP